jgi:cellulose synthase/poly-beta-1,6-N-acetylglucosamine synthase-like glycosyltransferase
MSQPLLSIIIPTHNRPQLLPLAVKSALAQTIEDFEVIVVDDASTQTAELPDDARLQVIRLSRSRGGAGARNVGTEAARGRWITYLDDDDRLLPHMAAISLEALEKNTLPSPVGVISGIEVVNEQGQVLEKRIPPAVRSRGAHFALEEIERDRSYNTKQTLMVEREVILKIGGWDEAFRSRVHTELFLRLNPVCSILGLPTITYQLYTHSNARVSTNPVLRQESFKQLIEKHQAIFKAHPKMFARFVYKHALRSYKMGCVREAFFYLSWAMQISPLNIFSLMASPLWMRLKQIPITNN